MTDLAPARSTCMDRMDAADRIRFKIDEVRR